MRRNNFKEWFKGKGFYISLVAGAVCVVAVAAVCLDTFGINSSMSDDEKRTNIARVEEKEDSGGLRGMADAEVTFAPVTPAGDEVQEVAELQESETGTITGAEEEEGEQAEAAQPAGTEEQEKAENQVKKKKEEQNDEDKQEETKTSSQDKQPEPEKVAVMKTGEKIKALKFDQEAGVSWPVAGEVIMKFSEDRAVYFKTLGQYKSNPALIISVPAGTNVGSAAESVVTQVGNNEEIGNYVETAIGDDYRIIYGQLDNVQVDKGDTLKEGELIGVVASPTKYYIEEGDNLYMKMMCGDEAVDPMIFLK